MNKFVSGIINRYYYAFESIKNRYPCRILRILDLEDLNKTTKIKYQAVTKINICTASIKDVLEDPMLVEKFHPTDAIKLGFLACGEVLLRDCKTIEEVRQRFKKISQEMLPNEN